MITNKRKLFIMIGAKTFRTCDKALLEKYTTNFVTGLNEEEIDFALSLFKVRYNASND